jgi:hypothetical protein
MAVQDRTQKFLPVIFILGAIILFFIGASDKSGSSSEKISARDIKVQERVNAHLSQTAEQLEMQKKRMQVENARLALSFRESNTGTGYTPQREGAELKEDARSQNVAQDLGLDELKRASSNPMDMIHHQLFEEQKLQLMDEAYKKEYARQFIENARRGGYDVKLNDEYKVISVKPARKPSTNYQLFDQN